VKGKFKSTVLVMISAVINSALVTVFNLVYNNLVIKNYGSSVTGLISTLGQFVTLFTIIEGGFSVAAVVASYEPILHGDTDKLNDILYTAKRYLQKITLIIAIVSGVLGCIYLQFIDSPLSSFETYSLLAITILTTSFSINFVSRYSIVLSGHNSQYITVFLSTISKTITWAISIVLIIKHANILYVYSLNLGFICLHFLLLKYYEHKKYPYIKYRGKYDKKLIKGTNDILFQKITSTIFTSTDLVLISAGINLASASVYYVYNQVFQAIYHYLTSVCNAPSDSFGHFIRQNHSEKLNDVFNIYQKSVQIISSIFFLTAGLTIIPFVKLYTRGVKDINYIVPGLAICLFSYYYLKLNNVPFGLIINASGNFKLQNKQCLIAAIVNIIASVILMKIIGVEGIVVGSILGTLIMTVMNILETLSNVLKTKSIKFFLILLYNFVFSLLLIIISIIINIEMTNYLWWILYCVLCFVTSCFLVILLNFIVDRATVRSTLQFMIQKIKRRVKRQANQNPTPTSSAEDQ